MKQAMAQAQAMTQQDKIDRYMEQFEGVSLERYTRGEILAWRAWRDSRRTGCPIVQMGRRMEPCEIADFIETLCEAGYTEMLYTAHDAEWLWTLEILHDEECTIGTYEQILYPDPHAGDIMRMQDGIMITL